MLNTIKEDMVNNNQVDMVNNLLTLNQTLLLMAVNNNLTLIKVMVKQQVNKVVLARKLGTDMIRMELMRCRV